MGLNVSHGCWVGSYGSFMRWRKELARAAGYGDLESYTGFGGSLPWPERPLTLLLNHSDCDGSIGWQDATSIATELESLMGGLDKSWVLTTYLFINGLRAAAVLEEDITFD